MSVAEAASRLVPASSTVPASPTVPAAAVPAAEGLAVPSSMPPSAPGPGWRARRSPVKADRSPGKTRTAETRYRIVSSSGMYSLVHCELVTGRTHQIRVHLAARGWPIVGDVKYGVPDPLIHRQALHARRMTLSHPRTRASLTLEAALPADMQRLCTEI